MKLRQIPVVCFFLCCFLAPAIVAQEKPDAVLLRKSGTITCEDLIATQDALIGELAADSTATGYIVIYGTKSDAVKPWLTKQLVEGQNEFRRFDDGRLVAVRGRVEEEFRLEFWKVPLGADKPDFGESDWDYRLSKATRPFAFYSARNDIGACPTGKWKNYAARLAANPEFRGHVVVFAGSNKEFQKESAGIRNKLVNERKVSPSQLRFFFVREKTEYSHYELWLVPPRKK